MTRLARWLLLALPLILLAGTLAGWWIATAAEERRIERFIDVESDRIRSEITARIRRYYDDTVRVVQQWRLRLPESREAWEYDVSSHRIFEPALGGMRWIDPDLTLRWVSPPNGSSDDPLPRAHLLRARDEGIPTAAGPMRSPFGGTGLSVAAPVLVGAEFEGWVVAWFDLQTTLAQSLEHLGVAFGVALFDGDERLFGRYDEDAGTIARWQEELTLEFDGFEARLRIWPTATTVERLRSNAPRIVLIAGLLTSVVLALALRLSHVSGLRAKEAELNERLQKQIAARRRAEKALERRARELERSNRELERFAYVVSHDLRDPLNAIGMNVQLTMSGSGKELAPDAHRRLESVMRSVARTEEMISGLLEYARAGQGSAAPEVVDSDELLRDALDNLAEPIERSDARITSGDLPEVRAQPTQLTSVFQNLVGNAIKYRAEGRPPEIHIDATKKEDAWIFSVRDNGVGMGPEVVDRAFELFWRRGDDAGGSGVGLAVCRRIVEAHGGSIWVEPDEGPGTTIRFSIPHEPSVETR